MNSSNPISKASRIYDLSEIRFSDNQKKTIQFIRSLEKKFASNRSKMLQGYKERIKNREKRLKNQLNQMKPIDHNPNIKSKVPITFKKEVMPYFNKLREKNFVKIVLPPNLLDGGELVVADNESNTLKIGEVIVIRSGIKNDDFFMKFEKNDNKINLVIRFPVTPAKLVSPAHFNLGDQNYKFATRKQLLLEQESEISIDSDDGESESDDGEVTENGELQTTGSIENMVNGILSPVQINDIIGFNALTLDNVTWQDFSDYRYIEEPDYSEIIATSPDLNVEEVELLEEIESKSINSDDLAQFLFRLRQEFKLHLDFIKRLDSSGFLGGFGYYSFREKILDRLMSSLESETEIFADLCLLYFAIGEGGYKTYFKSITENFSTDGRFSAFYYYRVGKDIIHEYELNARWHVIHSIVLSIWGKLLEEVPEGETPSPSEPSSEEVVENYPFDIYQPGSVNLGLRLVYRQEWRQLGNQRGEIVRTIPLGPKQIEKISTKVVRRTKISRTSEHLISTETFTETTDTQKDSSEVIEEASKTFGWHAEAEASARWGWGDAKVSGGMQGEKAESSKETSTELTEKMVKTSSKIRTETKVVVSTESENTFESTVSSEIQNPNEEISLTYVFSKLQRQYEVFTSLAEVHNVIMIAEPMVASADIDVNWVKKYDWIIAKALLDDSYREALTMITQDIPVEEIDTNKITNMMDSAKTSMEYLAQAQTSLSEVDVIQEAQRAYRESLKENQDKKRNKQIFERKKQRLLMHIRDNILHYYRAIWSQEDPQSRLLRYRKLGIEIPLNWNFVGTFRGEENEWLISDLLEAVERAETDQDENTFFDLDGKFCRINNANKVNLADLINPAGPIGFQGNYAIFYIRPEYASADMFSMFHILKTPYLDYTSDPESPPLIDPYLKKLKSDHEGEGPVSEEDRLEMIQYVPELRLLYAVAKSRNKESLENFFRVFKITDQTLDKLATIDGMPESVINGLADLKSSGPQTFAEFKDLIIETIGHDYYNQFSTAILKYSDQGIFTKYYPEYLFRKELSRRFLLETNNLVIDIIPGEGSALEGFKLAHRGIDVLKAVEEKEKLKLENKRRKKLLKAGRLEDPDIEKSIKIEGDIDDVNVEVDS